MTLKTIPVSWAVAVAVALGVSLAGPDSRARAGTVLDLTVANTSTNGIVNGHTYGTVEYTVSGNSVTIDFKTAASDFSSFGVGSNFGFDSVGFMSLLPMNTATGVTVNSHGHGAWVFATNPPSNTTSEDGWGKFSLSANPARNNSSRTTEVTVTFNLSGASLGNFLNALSPNTPNPSLPHVSAAAHIAGWGGNGGLSNYFGATPPHVVPEPASIVLALTGLAGLGWARLPRLRREAASA